MPTLSNLPSRSVRRHRSLNDLRNRQAAQAVVPLHPSAAVAAASRGHLDTALHVMATAYSTNTALLNNCLPASPCINSPRLPPIVPKPSQQLRRVGRSLENLKTGHALNHIDFYSNKLDWYVDPDHCGFSRV